MFDEAKFTIQGVPVPKVTQNNISLLGDTLYDIFICIINFTQTFITSQRQ